MDLPAIGSNQAPQQSPFSTPTPQKIMEAPPTMTQQVSMNEPPKSRRSGRKIIFASIILLLLVCAVAAEAWGLNTYDKYSRALPAISLLPADPNLVLSITTNPDSTQFKQLEQHLEKFPGYQNLKEQLDDKGQGKTISQIIQDNVKKYNLDFQQDLQPVLGNTAYIAINDLSPLGNKLQENTLTSLKTGSDFIASLSGEKKSNNQALLATNDSAQLPAVMGVSDEKNPADSTNNSMFPTLDFVAATEIKDVGKAENIIKKLQANGGYSGVKKSFEGYTYYQISTTSAENPYKQLFSAIVGKNLVVSSTEDGLKGTIELGNKNRTFNFFSQKSTSLSLAENKDFKDVSNNIGTNDFLIKGYAKINFNKFFSNNPCDSSAGTCTSTSISNYVQYPDDIIMGLNFSANIDGLQFTATSNKANLSDIQNEDLGKSLAERIPQKIESKLASIFTQHNNINELYYGFKKNNLTETGLTAWNDEIKAIDSAIGFNLETDFIDQIDGHSNLAIYTQADNEPAGAIIIHIKDSAAMYVSVEKITTAIKSMLASSLSSMNAYLKDSTYPESKTMLQENEKKLAAINATKITTTDTPNGKIYSFKIVGTPISFDFSLENKELILGSHWAVVESLLASQQSPIQPTLATDELFARAQKYSQKDGFSQSFISTQGVVDIANYFLAGSMSSDTNFDTPAENNDSVKFTPPAQSQENPLFAPEAILRTIKFIHASQSTQGPYVKSNIFFDIKELPAQEKSRAQSIIDSQDQSSW